MSSPKKEQVATMRHHLEKIMQEEKARARINQLKIRNQWRKIMRTAKVEALQEEITILAQVFIEFRLVSWSTIRANFETLHVPSDPRS
jgi:hypothetical protein